MNNTEMKNRWMFTVSSIFLTIHRALAADSQLKAPPDDQSLPDVHWLFRLIPILTGYGVFMLIGYLLIQWIQKRVNENDHLFSHNFFFCFLRQFALGRPEYRLGMNAVKFTELKQQEENEELQQSTKIVDQSETIAKRKKRKNSSIKLMNGFIGDFIFISFYFLGIQICLVCMGFFQERIMTRRYQRRGGGGQTTADIFNDAQFLVFANRFVALLLSGFYLLFTWKRYFQVFYFSLFSSQPIHVPPLYLHSFASFSNVISSWCQYEALKYVSFPTQTVCKASKIVPTMLMGKLIRRQRYSANEYLLAFVLVIGASILFFSMASTSTAPLDGSNQKNAIQLDNQGGWMQHLQGHSDTISGLILMVAYLLFDAFTPNWQKRLFDQPPRISTAQMMFAVNTFSVFLCLISLLHQWTLLSSLQFILSHESILFDCLLLSFGSAFGQVFIYMTIKRFGPVVLSVLMTIRQILSIFLSSIYFVHPISLNGLIGLLLVFIAIFFDIYSKYKIRKRRR